VDVNRGTTHAFEYDQVNIICPKYEDDGAGVGEMERYVIYVVGEEEYATCRVMSQHPRVIAKCDSPLERRFFTISFRSFSPTPGAVEFKPGRDYFFISTSSPTDIHQRVGGMCRDGNMKLVFKVADPNAPETTTTTSTTTTATESLSNKVLAAAKEEEEQEEEEGAKRESEGKRAKRKKKKKRRRRQQRRKHNKELNDFLPPPPSTVDPPPLSRETGFVEKVNNLMKQEASIRAPAAAASSATQTRQTFAHLLFLLFPLAVSSSCSSSHPVIC